MDAVLLRSKHFVGESSSRNHPAPPLAMPSIDDSHYLQDDTLCISEEFFGCFESTFLGGLPLDFAEVVCLGRMLLAVAAKSLSFRDSNHVCRV
jgi:hypothetical protein